MKNNNNNNCAFTPLHPSASLRHDAAKHAAAAIAASSARTQQFTQPAQKRVRELMYGAGGAFRGLASHWPPSGGNRNSNFNGGNGRSDGDDGNDEWNVDPSWGIAPGVHVILRRNSDVVYAAAVAQLVQMSQVIPQNMAFVGDPSVPVVVMLSWMGAQQKHLDKYRKFYEDLGYEVHFIFNGLRTAILPGVARNQSNKLENFISQQPNERPVFIHAFSIGTGIYGLLLNRIKEDMEKLESFKSNVTGVIFDSGPAPIFPVDVAKGLHTVCPMISKNIWEPLTASVFRITQARAAFSEAEDALRRFQFKAPQLYFYSLDDKVIPNIHKAVEDFIDKNKQRGVEVYNKWWKNSTHASHLKIHHDEYLHSLEAFVKRCMQVRELEISNAAK